MTDTKTDDRAVIIVDMDDPYVSSLIKEEFGLYRSDKWRLVDARENGVDVQAEIGQAKHVFRWGEYENLDWDAIAAGKMSTMWYMNVSSSIFNVCHAVKYLKSEFCWRLITRASSTRASQEYCVVPHGTHLRFTARRSHVAKWSHPQGSDGSLNR